MTVLPAGRGETAAVAATVREFLMGGTACPAIFHIRTADGRMLPCEVTGAGFATDERADHADVICEELNIDLGWRHLGSPTDLSRVRGLLPPDLAARAHAIVCQVAGVDTTDRDEACPSPPG